MRTREEFLRFALSLGDVYRDAPFHDDNWILVRHRANISRLFHHTESKLSFHHKKE